MKHGIKLFIAAAASIAGIGLAVARDDLPWAFNGKRAEGYTIDLVSITPEPGTPLIVGQTVDFKVTVRYENKVAPTGSILLVFQTDKGSAKPEGEKQVSTKVTDPSGTVTLEDRITIPKKAKEIDLFIPLVPQGLTETYGEVTVRYPIKKK